MLRTLPRLALFQRRPELLEHLFGARHEHLAGTFPKGHGYSYAGDASRIILVIPDLEPYILLYRYFGPLWFGKFLISLPCLNDYKARKLRPRLYVRRGDQFQPAPCEVGHPACDQHVPWYTVWGLRGR